MGSCAPVLQLFGKADDPVCLFKASSQMKAKALLVMKLAVAGKLPTALLPRPGFAGGEKPGGDASAPVFFKNIDALQIAHRACVVPST